MQKYEGLRLPELVENLMRHLEEKGHTLSYRNRLIAYYKVLLKYAKKQNIPYFNLEIGKTFLWEHHKHQWEISDKLPASKNYLQRHIMMLHEFQIYGKIISRKRIIRIYAVPHFDDLINDYLEQERRHGLREGTLAGKRHALNQIFEYFESAGLQTAKDIMPSHVYGFLESRAYFSVTTKERYQYIFRSLIQYLRDNNLCQAELQKLFAVISIHTKNAYPSHFKANEIAQMLCCVDTTTAAGRRDYLILLLAAELGMRTSDICALKIKDINFQKKHVEYIQVKTGDAVMLPMSDELFFAFADYLKNARPKCEFEEVIVKDRAPIEPYRNGSFHGMLQKYLSKAEIKTVDGQKHGLHSLRSSLASNLLQDGVPIPVISNILGHKYADTTSLYLKIDLPGLRRASLEVPAL
jgi:site-specific recombinase XerD